MTYLLEVRLAAVELEVLRVLDQAAAVFDDLLEADACPLGGADGSFGPGRVDHLVAFAGVLGDLLDAARAAALDRDELADAGKEAFVLQVG